MEKYRELLEKYNEAYKITRMDLQFWNFFVNKNSSKTIIYKIIIHLYSLFK